MNVAAHLHFRRQLLSMNTMHWGLADSHALCIYDATSSLHLRFLRELKMEDLAASKSPPKACKTILFQ